MFARLIAAGIFFVGAIAVVPTARAARDYGYQGDSVECASRDYRFTRCSTGWRDARIVRQTSDSRCVRGSTWGVDRQGLWVDRGCAGIFAEAGSGHGGPGYGGGYGGAWQPGPDWDQDIRFRCGSVDYGYNYCAVDIGRGGRIYIERQVSKSACVEGRTWGYNRGGVWVDQGCEAEFVVERRWR